METLGHNYLHHEMFYGFFFFFFEAEEFSLEPYHLV